MRSILLRGVFLLGLGAGVSGCALVGGSTEELRRPDEPPPRPSLEDLVERSITPGAVSSHIEFLASPPVVDRDSGQVRMDRLAAWLSSEFQRARLQPAGDDGGYVQYRAPDRSAAVQNGRAPGIPNVVAVVPGADSARAGEYVVVVARFGHAGGPESGLDGLDVSSAAALVEVGRVLASLPARPPRPVLLLAAGMSPGAGDGADWFVRHPTVRLDDAVAVLTIGVAGDNGKSRIDVAEHKLSLFGAAGAVPASQSTTDEQLAWVERGFPTALLSTGVPVGEADRLSDAGGPNALMTAQMARVVLLAAHRLADGAAVASPLPATPAVETPLPAASGSSHP